MRHKKARDLGAGDTIGVSAAILGKTGADYYKVPVIDRKRLGRKRWAIHTPGGIIQCDGDFEFPIVPPLELTTDTLTPTMPTKKTYKGRTID